MSVIVSGSPPVWLIFHLEIAALIFVSSIFDMEPGRMSVHLEFDGEIRLVVFDIVIVCVDLVESRIEVGY